MLPALLLPCLLLVPCCCLLANCSNSPLFEPPWEKGPSGGKEQLDDSERGLTPRVLEELFIQMARKQLASAATGRPVYYRCCCSYLQVYNDTLTDLLESSRAAESASTPVSLRIRESAERGIHVENLTQLRVRSADEALAALARGAANRRTASTFMNATSSRSHAVFIIRVEQVAPAKSRKGSTAGAEHVCSSSLSLVDLAGSERQQSAAKPIDHAGEEERAAKQATAVLDRINQLTGTPGADSVFTPVRPPASRSSIRESHETIFEADEPESAPQRRLLCRTNDERSEEGAESDTSDAYASDCSSQHSISHCPVATKRGWGKLRDLRSMSTPAQRKNGSFSKPTRNSSSGSFTRPPNALGALEENSFDKSRLQEACAINKSLSALSGVIIALNEVSPPPAVHGCPMPLIHHAPLPSGLAHCVHTSIVHTSIVHTSSTHTVPSPRVFISALPTLVCMTCAAGTLARTIPRFEAHATPARLHRRLGAHVDGRKRLASGALPHGDTEHADVSMCPSPPACSARSHRTCSHYARTVRLLIHLSYTPCVHLSPLRSVFASTPSPHSTYVPHAPAGAQVCCPRSKGAKPCREAGGTADRRARLV